jgi:hypothetical protein
VVVPTPPTDGGAGTAFGGSAAGVSDPFFVDWPKGERGTVPFSGGATVFAGAAGFGSAIFGTGSATVGWAGAGAGGFGAAGAAARGAGAAGGVAGAFANWIFTILTP